MCQSYLYVKFKITNTDCTNLAADVSVAPTNNFIHSMFSSIDLYLNNKLVSSNMDTYPYRAYIENLLSYNTDSKVTYLKASDLWVNDTVGSVNALTHNDVNEGLNKE